MKNSKTLSAHGHILTVGSLIMVSLDSRHNQDQLCLVTVLQTIQQLFMSYSLYMFSFFVVVLTFSALLLISQDFLIFLFICCSMDVVGVLLPTTTYLILSYHRRQTIFSLIKVATSCAEFLLSQRVVYVLKY